MKQTIQLTVTGEIKYPFVNDKYIPITRSSSTKSKWIIKIGEATDQYFCDFDRIKKHTKPRSCKGRD